MTTLTTQPETSELATVQPKSILSLLELGVTKDIKPESMECLYRIWRDDQAHEAEKEFLIALTEFRSTCPDIPKNGVVDYTTDAGYRVVYRFAKLDDIDRIVSSAAAKHGLSYTWDTQLLQDKVIEATCILRHTNGHSIKSSFPCPVSAMAKMNAAQQAAAANSYAKRQTLISVLGLTAVDTDTDGAGPQETISEEQAGTLDMLLNEVHADRPAFFGWAGVTELDQLPAAMYGPACRLLEGRRKNQASKSDTPVSDSVGAPWKS